MNQSVADVHRLRSLIFESVARPDMFGDLIAQTDAAMRDASGADLSHLAPEFEDASDAMMRSGAFGKVASETEFLFDRKARVTTCSASAVLVFGLEPGKSLVKQVGESGRAALDDLLRGRRSQASFTLFTYPRLRPVPVLAQSLSDGRFRAIAITLRWNGAIVPLLKSGYELTDAEIEVVESLFRGHQPKEIANQRGRSLETVRTQVRQICRKTDTHGHVDIVHLVYGLIATTQFIHTNQTAAEHGNFMLTLPSGRRVDIECTGPQTGKPLLFLHGCLAGRRLPDAALERFRDRRIIAPGRPGHGQTAAMDTLDIDAVVQDLFHILDHFNQPAIDVLTYDLGAPFGLRMAMSQPQRVRSLTCLAPVPPLIRLMDIWSLPVETRVFSVLSKINPSAAHFLALVGGQRILRQGPKEFGQIVFANSSFDRDMLGRDEAAQRLFWHGHAWHVECGPHGFLSDAKLSSTPWHQELSRLEPPVTFVVGKNDRNCPKGGLNRLAQRVHADVREIPDAGHSLLHASTEKWLRLVCA